MRTVITPVGISLLENMWSGKTREQLQRFGVPTLEEVRSLERTCKMKLLAPQAAADLTHREAKQMAEGFESAFRGLWDSEDGWYTAGGGRRKRLYSPAELASLSLLDLQPGDGVVLLYSETARGAFCAAVLERMLQQGVAVPAGLEVEKRMVRGLQLEDLERFTNKGMVSYARAVRQVVDDQQDPASVLLNITGGYKGVAPIATIVAMALKVEVCYLYEESDEMLFLPALDVAFGFSRLFENYRPKMQLITPPDDPLPSAAEQQVWEGVAEEHRDEFKKYLKTVDGKVQLSPLGVLSWILHKCQRESREASPRGRLTHE